MVTAVARRVDGSGTWAQEGVYYWLKTRRKESQALAIYMRPFGRTHKRTVVVVAAVVFVLLLLLFLLVLLFFKKSR